MKKNNLKVKLNLNKEAISNLNDVKGGGEIKTLSKITCYEATACVWPCATDAEQCPGTGLSDCICN